MARPPEQPQWALIVSPSGRVKCIPLRYLMVATIRGARLLATERDLLPWPVDVEPSQSNPRRTSEE